MMCVLRTAEQSSTDADGSLIKEVDELVDEWHPEPLVSPPSAFEERDLEQRPTIIGCVSNETLLYTSPCC